MLILYGFGHRAAFSVFCTELEVLGERNTRAPQGKKDFRFQMAALLP